MRTPSTAWHAHRGVARAVRSNLARTVSAMMVAAAVCTVPVRVASAQLTVDRDAMVIVAGEGNTTTTRLTVRNTSAGEVEATVTLAGWTVELDGSTLGIRVQRARCDGLLTISPAKLRIGPGEVQIVEASIRGGAHVTQECWGAAILQPTRVVSRAFSTEPTRLERTVIPLYVTPAEHPAVRIALLRSTTNSPSMLDLVIVNAGLTRTDISGTITLGANAERSQIEYEVTTLTLLPGARRIVRIPLSRAASRVESITASFDCGGDAPRSVQLQPLHP